MATQLATHKRLLTRFSNRLENVVGKIRTEKLEDLSLDPNTPREGRADNIANIIIEEAIKAIETIMEKAQRQAWASQKDPENGRSVQMSLVHGSETLSTTVMSYIHAKPMELPNNIHSSRAAFRKWSNSNYLSDALKGEAREHEIQSHQGQLLRAVACLHKKNNNREAVVNQLVERLEFCALRTPSMRDQRSLLEQLQAITTQLQDKGEDVNSSWLVKKVLASFRILPRGGS
ncbi:hypothetical protein OSTOST_11811 [Ostertagia ostertagi]